MPDRFSGRKAGSRSAAFGTVIHIFRLQAEISRKVLSETMGLTRNTVLNWEAGKYRPESNLISGLCEELHMPVTELFGLQRDAPLQFV